MEEKALLGVAPCVLGMENFFPLIEGLFHKKHFLLAKLIPKLGQG